LFSIISVAATALFLQIVYLQFVKGKAVYGYPWAVPQLFSGYLRILRDKCAPGLEWALHSPPKPHAFTSLPLQIATCPGCGLLLAFYTEGMSCPRCKN
jgi:cytochrome c oxidase subunit 1